jgi:hypothetical protein
VSGLPPFSHAIARDVSCSISPGGAGARGGGGGAGAAGGRSDSKTGATRAAAAAGAGVGRGARAGVGAVSNVGAGAGGRDSGAAPAAWAASFAALICCCSARIRPRRWSTCASSAPSIAPNRKPLASWSIVAPTRPKMRANPKVEPFDDGSRSVCTLHRFGVVVMPRGASCVSRPTHRKRTRPPGQRNETIRIKLQYSSMKLGIGLPVTTDAQGRANAAERRRRASRLAARRLRRRVHPCTWVAVAMRFIPRGSAHSRWDN